MKAVRIYVAAATVGAAHTPEWWVLLRGSAVHREPDKASAEARAVALATAMCRTGTAAEVWLSRGGSAVRCWPVDGGLAED